MQRRAHLFAVFVVAAVLLIAVPSTATDTTTVVAALRQHSAEFERCFDEFEPSVASSVTIAFVVNREGYGVRASIVEGRAGLDSPGLCLVDQFMLRPGVQFDDPHLRGQRFRATFAFSPNASPRLDITAR